MNTGTDVCHLTSVHPPFDTRIYHKECVSLCEAGYRVTLVAGGAEAETRNGITIVPFPRFNRRFFRILLSPIRMAFTALRLKAVLYHFHDPELMSTGILLRCLGKKVVYDVHEDVPKQILNKSWLGAPAVRKVVSVLAAAAEKTAACFCHALVAATPGIASKFRGVWGLPLMMS